MCPIDNPENHGTIDKSEMVAIDISDVSLIGPTRPNLPSPLSLSLSDTLLATSPPHPSFGSEVRPGRTHSLPPSRGYMQLALASLYLCPTVISAVSTRMPLNTFCGLLARCHHRLVPLLSSHSPWLSFAPSPTLAAGLYARSQVSLEHFAVSINVITLIFGLISCVGIDSRLSTPTMRFMPRPTVTFKSPTARPSQMETDNMPFVSLSIVLCASTWPSKVLQLILQINSAGIHHHYHSVSLDKSVSSRLCSRSGVTSDLLMIILAFRFYPAVAQSPLLSSI